jgi:hypothetical protein
VYTATAAGWRKGTHMGEMAFIDGLLWYLETREWAFKKLQSMSGDVQHFDLKMYHYLYLTNLLGAIDTVCDYMNSSDVVADFELSLGRNNYQYVREFRNAVVHRGLDPSYISLVDDNQRIFVLCPKAVYDRTRQKSYTCTFTYTIELAAFCNGASNKAIFKALDGRGFFNESDISIGDEEALDADIRSVLTMSPAEWENVDFETLTAIAVKRRTVQLKAMLNS